MRSIRKQFVKQFLNQEIDTNVGQSDSSRLSTIHEEFKLDSMSSQCLSFHIN